MRTELGKVRGLGSAKHGAGHWWLQRVSANTPYTDFERRMLDSPSMAPSGSAGKLMQEYNSLVFQSNRQ